MSPKRAPHPRRTFLSALLAAVGLASLPGLAATAQATPLVGRPKGRPRIKVDRITLPSGTANADELERHLKFILRKEARRAD